MNLLNIWSHISQAWHYLVNILKIWDYIWTPEVLFSVIVSICTTYLSNNYFSKKTFKKINNSAEKIKADIQREYVKTELKTKNLIEIYPQLHQLVRGSGSLAIKFDFIKKDIDACSTAETLKALVAKIFASSDNTEDLKYIVLFNDYLELKFLFISNAVQEKADAIKTQLMGLYGLVQDEIVSSVYQTYSYDELVSMIQRAEIMCTTLAKDKQALADLMKNEMNPQK
jgi:hypothetical protein